MSEINVCMQTDQATLTYWSNIIDSSTVLSLFFCIQYIFLFYVLFYRSHAELGTIDTFPVHFESFQGWLWITEPKKLPKSEKVKWSMWWSRALTFFQARARSFEFEPLERSSAGWLYGMAPALDELQEADHYIREYSGPFVWEWKLRKISYNGLNRLRRVLDRGLWRKSIRQYRHQRPRIVRSWRCCYCTRKTIVQCR